MSDEKEKEVGVKEVGEKPRKQTIAEMELEIKKLELEAKQLEIIDLRERVDERKLKREEKGARSVTNGNTLRQLAATDAANQARCNHRKGGNGAQGVIAGQGDDTNYAIIRHTFCNGDTWVRCLRCGKTWKPPLRDRCATEEQYLTDFASYRASLEWPTRNQPSGSIQFRFSDGGASFRELMANTTLR